MTVVQPIHSLIVEDNARSFKSVVDLKFNFQRRAWELDPRPRADGVLAFRYKSRAWFRK